MKMIGHETICAMGEDKCSENSSQPNSIPGPGNSKFFDMSKKGLKEFPVYLFGACFCIECLYLEGNVIEDLTECFFPSLPSLQWLDVRNNVLKSFPKSVANHPNLEVLLLEGNQIKVLPLELGLVPKLRGIQLSGNPLTYPPKEVLAKGVHSILEFLREEHSIQAPSPSTIRPISGPFYKRAELKDGLRKYKSNVGTSGQDKNSLSVYKKRASSSKLPLITVKGYKSDLDLGPPRPSTSVPVCQFKLSETPGQAKEIIINEKKELPDLSNQIRSVSNKILQLWPKNTTLSAERSSIETKIQENLLKEMFMRKIREILERQTEIMQRTKDEETLKKWRKNRAHLKK